VENDDRPYRCACHNRDAHLYCPALRALRNFSFLEGRSHLECGRIKPGAKRAWSRNSRNTGKK
jgi:hypothetical protein